MRLCMDDDNNEEEDEEETDEYIYIYSLRHTLYIGCKVYIQQQEIVQ